MLSVLFSDPPSKGCSSQEQELLAVDGCGKQQLWCWWKWAGGAPCPGTIVTEQDAEIAVEGADLFDA